MINKRSIIIGITGGSGVGKSTLCNALKQKYPDKIQLIQLDDYFKPAEDKSKIGELVNSDHPDALYIYKFYNDLKTLAQGNSITIETKNPFLNPNYKITKQKIPVLLESKPIILAEGFLLLYDNKIRNLLDYSFYLDANHDIRWERRENYSNKNSEYESNVIIPMHKEYTEPTKKYAHKIINADLLDTEKVFREVEKIILKNDFK